MVNLAKGVQFLTAILLIVMVPEVYAVQSNRGHHRHEWRRPKKELHPQEYVGIYFRSDVVSSDQSNPIVTLNADGTAILYYGFALDHYVTEGTVSPGYGNWEYSGDGKVLVMTLSYTALDTPAESFELVARDTFIIDFSCSLDFPLLVARSLVELPVLPSCDYSDPNAGTVIFNDPIAPRQLERVHAFGSDLYRNPV